MIIIDTRYAVKNYYENSSIELVPSAVLSVFYSDQVLHLTIDNGCTGNIIRLNVVENMDVDIKPTKVKAKLADDKTFLDVVGEISIMLTRGKVNFNFNAIVVRNLGPDALAGTPFQKENDIMTDFVNEQIIVKKKIRFPFTSQHVVEDEPDTFLVRIQKSEIILPGEYLNIKIPKNNPPSQEYVIENRDCKIFTNPIVTESVGYNVRIPNCHEYPLEVRKNSHLQVRRMKLCNVNSTDMKHEYPKKPHFFPEDSLQEVSIDPSKKLFDETQVNKIKDVLQEVKIVFENDDSTYKGEYLASFEFSSETRPTLKNSKLPSYSSKHNCLLQQKCDKLWSRGKIVPISKLGIQPNCLNQPFLVKKQKAMHKKLEQCTEKDTRMVTSFGPLAKLVKKNVSKVTSEKEVWAKLAQWKYIAESDLTDSFHQLVLKRSDKSIPVSNTNVDCPSYMCFKTPYKGIFAYVTGAQGMPGMSEHLDNVLDVTIGDLIQANKAFKIHDQIYVGGQDFSTFIDNIKEVFGRLGKAGLRLGADKTIIGVYTSVIYGKLWNNGTLTPSQHKITNLAKVPIPDTVGKLRSFIQGSKINSECLEGLASALAPFGKLVGSDKNRQEKVPWTPELEQSFYKAQEILENPTSISIPKPTDNLLIVVDTATKPEGLDSTPAHPTTGESASSATLFLKRKGEKQLRIGGYFGFKVKSNMLPCEAEAKGLERAVEHWDHYIRENQNPTTCLVDNNPVVQCAKKLANGEYSESPRLQSFLYLLNSKNLNIQHNSAKIPNKLIESVDWGSRNHVECKADTNLPGMHENCPYCDFVWKNDDISFAPVRHLNVESIDMAKNCDDVNIFEIDIEDVLRKSSLTPFKTRASWLNLQKTCPDMRKAVAHIKAGTVPTFKEKNIRDARYYIQHCKVDKDGLLVHEKQVLLEPKPRHLIVVPQAYLRALVLQLHTYCDVHTTEHQTDLLFGRMFWSIRSKDVIKDVVNECKLCLSTKSFPKQLLQYHTETTPKSICSHFAADVMVKGKKFLILREILTSHTATINIKDEKADTLKDALMILLSHYKTMKTVQVRVDNQSGFYSLKDDKTLGKLNIQVIPGDSKNVNKNPVAERAVREIEDEILKIQPSDREITTSILAQATMAVNNKIRYTGYSANELLTNTNSITGNKLKVEDEVLSNLQFENRQKAHIPSARAKSTSRGALLVNPIVRQGDLVMIKTDKSKHEARKTYVVVGIDDENRAAVVQKFVNNQFRSKKYRVKIEQIILVEKAKPYTFNNIPEIHEHDNAQDNVTEQEAFNLDEFGTIEEEEELPSQRRGRNKDRLDYFALNETGNKILKAQKVTKIDFRSKCQFCFSRKFSNFYHSEEICVRKMLESKDDEIDLCQEEGFIDISTPQEINNEVMEELEADEDESDLDDVKGIQGLHKDLVDRGVNVDLCAKEVLALVQDYIDFHTVGAKVQMAVVKIQTWWRKMLRAKFKQRTDQSLSQTETISLEEESVDEWESLYNETEINSAIKKREMIQKLIDNEQNVEDVNEEVFEVENDESLMEENVQGKEKGKKTDSTDLNVFAPTDSRPNSEELFVTTQSNSQRRLSLDPEEMRYNTRSSTRRAALARIPLVETPLKQRNISEESTPPGSP